jgi:hypothetical protein
MSNDFDDVLNNCDVTDTQTSISKHYFVSLHDVNNEIILF